MDLKTAMMNRIKSMKDEAVWEKSLDMSWESMAEIVKKHDLSKIEHIYLVGCGTSLANAYIGESFIEGIARLPAETQHAFSFSHYVPEELLNERTLVLGISGFGNTTSVEESLKFADRAGALTIAVTGSSTAKCSLAAKEVLMTDALNEGPTVRTVSNIFLQLGLYVFAIAFGESKGTIDPEKRHYWDEQLDLLISKVKDVLVLESSLKQLAKKYHDLQGEMIFMLGAGPNFGTAWEGALMAVEMAWIDSVGYEMEEFIHGRFRESDERKPILFIAPKGKTYAKLVSILETANKAKAPTVIFTDDVTEDIRKRATDIIVMPGGIDEVLTPLLYVFPLWMFDYYTGIERGVDPAGVRHGITAVDINIAEL